jgi:protein-tyrosine phosphatase
MNVLFVCSGNVCRSPMAEGMFRRKSSLAGLNVECDSAGTFPHYPGSPPDWRAIRVARQYAVNIADLRSRAVTAEDFGRASLMIAMDQRGLDHLKAMAPAGATARIVLMLDYDRPRAGRSVRDPYSGHLSDFFDCWRSLHPAVNGLIATLQMEVAA